MCILYVCVLHICINVYYICVCVYYMCMVDVDVCVYYICVSVYYMYVHGGCRCMCVLYMCLCIICMCMVDVDVCVCYICVCVYYMYVHGGCRSIKHPSVTWPRDESVDCAVQNRGRVTRGSGTSVRGEDGLVQCSPVEITKRGRNKRGRRGHRWNPSRLPGPSRPPIFWSLA